MDAFAPLIAGSLAGQMSLLVVQPMDVLRTRVQTNPEYKNVFDCFQKTLQNEGPKAFYKGMLTPFLAQGLYKSIMFGSFHHTSQYFKNKNQSPILYPYQLLLCGSISGIINSVVVTPVELIRNRLIVHQNNNLTSKPTITSIIRNVIATDGIKGLWKGQLACSIRDCFGVGAYFYGNNRAVNWLQNNTSLNNGQIQLLGGMFAGICFWTISLPLDRIKSILQTTTTNNTNNNNATITSLFQTIIKNEGIKGLYKGLSLGLGRGIPAGAVTFYVNNLVLNQLKSTKDTVKQIKNV